MMLAFIGAAAAMFLTWSRGVLLSRKTNGN
jgi:hypothetical protein